MSIDLKTEFDIKRLHYKMTRNTRIKKIQSQNLRHQYKIEITTWNIKIKLKTPNFS